MYRIKNVVNYDRDALERELELETARFYSDKRLIRLMRRRVFIICAKSAVSFLGFACAVCGFCLVFSEDFKILSRVLTLVGCTLCTLHLTVLSSFVPKTLKKITEQICEILETYGNTLPLRFHVFLSLHGAEKVEIWGAEAKDSKFEVVLSNATDAQAEKITLLCDYKELDASGVLTLDVGNCSVVRAKLAR